NFSNPTNNRLHASFNTRNQAIIQGDRVNIQSRNSGNIAILEEIPDELMFKRKLLREWMLKMRLEIGKGHYARNCPKPRVRDSKYFMEQMLLAKQDEAGVILTDEQNDFLFANASRMEEIEELSANVVEEGVDLRRQLKWCCGQAASDDDAGCGEDVGPMMMNSSGGVCSRGGKESALKRLVLGDLVESGH
ncbi:hypothetical protein Tco_0533631, partial [Tanacetum coccineum]